MPRDSASQERMDDPYLHRLKVVEFRPVFMMGAHRSGTTVLYQALVHSACFNRMTLFHQLNRRRLLHLRYSGTEHAAKAELTEILKRRRISDRGYDSQPVTPDSLSEYCYSFERQTRRPILTPANLAEFRTFCRKLQFVQYPQWPLLLKNPFDTANFLFVRETFPDARFIFIHRNPMEVINSQFVGILSMLERKNDYEALVSERYRRTVDSRIRFQAARLICSRRLPLLLMMVAANVARTCDYVLRNIDQLEGAAASVTYADLCREPSTAVSRILDFLGLEGPRFGYEALIRTRNLEVAPEVAAHSERIERRNRAYIRRFLAQ